ncbi:MAG TPA: DUF3108 domain-containing protein [Kofleriaceae bacterium]|jgi:hypothetical protein|nr:DUF3108 domain-containing protein [Kofleriaceae bacterium]
MRCAGLLILVGCATADATTAPVPPPSPALPAPDQAAEVVGLTPGETMGFEIKVAGLMAGEAQLAVGQLGDYQGHRAVIVKSRAETAGAFAIAKHVVDEATTVIDMETGRPLSLETAVEQGDARTTATATFQGNVAEITTRRPDGPNGKPDPRPRVQRVDFGAFTVHDAHSAMAQLRGWRARPGERRTVFVVGGRRPWRIVLTCAGGETIGGAALGNRRAVRFTGEAFHTKRDLTPETVVPARSFSVWLSDDADRVPLRLTASTELGAITMDLTEYNR